MVQYGAIFPRGIAVSVQKTSWVDPYLDFGCTISDNTPIFHVSEWKGVREFSNGTEEI